MNDILLVLQCLRTLMSIKLDCIPMNNQLYFVQTLSMVNIILSLEMNV